MSSLLRDFPGLLRHAPRARLAGFLLAALLALGLGFFAFAPATGAKFISRGGYYYMLGLFALFVHALWRLAPRPEEMRALLRRHRGPLAAVLAASAFALWSDPFKHKILFDEYVLQGTAYYMHATKEVGTVVRAYEIDGTWLPLDTFLDKRPYFFAFLVSLAHDFTGFRVENIFFVNALLTPLCLGLVYAFGCQLAGRTAGLLAACLLATMPLLGQQASGAGMELHNLTMVVLALVLGTAYLRRPDEDRLSAFVCGTLLLAQSRYESVLFVVPAALVVAAGWWRARRVILTWPAIVAPLLLVPYLWQNRMLSATPVLWQLGEGQTARFAAKYLAGNLEGAWKFFFNAGPELANSWYLSALGALSGVLALATAWRRARRVPQAPLAPATFMLGAFGAAIAANLALLMFYYWSRLDDVVASRFALPACLLLALLAGWAVQRLAARWNWAGWTAAAGLGVWLLGWGFPAMAKRTYTDQNLVMQEVEWEHEELLKLAGPVLFISNKSTIPYVLWRVPTILNSPGGIRGDRIRYHLEQGTFRTVIVAQALRPTTPEGDLGIDPDDLLPAGIALEPVAVKRFGGRWIRLSRVVSIAADIGAPPPVDPKAPGPTRPMRHLGQATSPLPGDKVAATP